MSSLPWESKMKARTFKSNPTNRGKPKAQANRGIGRYKLKDDLEDIEPLVRVFQVFALWITASETFTS